MGKESQKSMVKNMIGENKIFNTSLLRLPKELTVYSIHELNCEELISPRAVACVGEMDIDRQRICPTL